MPTVPLLLAVIAAATYGTSDFFGTTATRSAGAAVVVFWSQLAGTAPLAIYLATVSTPPDGNWARWGAAAGLAGGTGMVLLYRALTRGRIANTAPTAAFFAAAGPVAWSWTTGLTPQPADMIGVAVGIVAVVLLATTTTTGGQTTRGVTPVITAAAAGVAFAMFYLALAQTPPQAHLWPLIAARCTSIPVAAAVAHAAARTYRPRQALSLPSDAVTHVACAGVLDMVANGAFLAATRDGDIGIVAVIISMGPAATALIARFKLGQRMTPIGIAGFVAAMVSIGILAVE